MITIHDVMQKNADQKIIIQRRLQPGAYASLVEDLYTGQLQSVPESLRNLEVKEKCWSVGSDCYILDVGYRPDLDDLDRQKRRK